jgi:hypothetical protein
MAKQLMNGGAPLTTKLAGLSVGIPAEPHSFLTGLAGGPISIVHTAPLTIMIVPYYSKEDRIVHRPAPPIDCRRDASAL